MKIVNKITFWSMDGKASKHKDVIDAIAKLKTAGLYVFSAFGTYYVTASGDYKHTYKQDRLLDEVRKSFADKSDVGMNINSVKYIGDTSFTGTISSTENMSHEERENLIYQLHLCNRMFSNDDSDVVILKGNHLTGTLSVKFPSLRVFMATEDALQTLYPNKYTLKFA